MSRSGAVTAVGNSSEVANTADTLEIYYAGYLYRYGGLHVQIKIRCTRCGASVAATERATIHQGQEQHHDRHERVRLAALVLQSRIAIVLVSKDHRLFF